jgi:hypothetical protein
LIIRDKLEQFMLQHALDGKLSPGEGLSFLETVRGEISKIQSAVAEGAVGGDVTTLLNKVNFATATNENLLSKQVKSSPQSRELVRKLIYRLAKLTRSNKPK